MLKQLACNPGHVTMIKAMLFLEQYETLLLKFDAFMGASYPPVF